MTEAEAFKKINGLVFYSQDIDALEIAERDEKNKNTIYNIRRAMLVVIEELINDYHKNFKKYPVREKDGKSIELNPGTIKNIKWETLTEKPERVQKLCQGNKNPIDVANDLVKGFNQAAGREIKIINHPPIHKSSTVEIDLNLPQHSSKKQVNAEADIFSLISKESIEIYKKLFNTGFQQGWKNASQDTYQIIPDNCSAIDITKDKVKTEIPSGPLTDEAKRSLDTLANALIAAVEEFIGNHEDLSQDNIKALKIVSIKTNDQTALDYLSQKYTTAGFTIGKTELIPPEASPAPPSSTPSNTPTKK